VTRSLSLLALDRLTSLYPTVDAAIEGAASAPPAPVRPSGSATDPAASAADGSPASS
jgi:hypothetical protein